MMNEIAEKAEAAFNRLQTMEIRTTLGNMEKLVASLYEIQDIYKIAKEGVENAAADHE